MQAKAIAGGRLASFRFSPELARAHHANTGKTMAMVAERFNASDFN